MLEQAKPVILTDSQRDAFFAEWDNLTETIVSGKINPMAVAATQLLANARNSPEQTMGTIIHIGKLINAFVQSVYDAGHESQE